MLQVIWSHWDHSLNHSFEKHDILRTYVLGSGLTVGIQSTKIPAFTKPCSSGGEGQTREINVNRLCEACKYEAEATKQVRGVRTARGRHWEGRPFRGDGQGQGGWAAVPTAAARLQPLALFISFSETLLILSSANTSVLLHCIGTRHFSKVSLLFMEESGFILLKSEDEGQW